MATLPRTRNLRASPFLLAGPLVALWVDRLLRLKRSVGEYADYWSQPRGE